MKIPCVKKTCKDCPFRKDSLESWLGRERMTGILKASSFVCHKNTDLQCAGHMLLKGSDNAFLSTARHFHIDLKLKGRELVFDSVKDCIDHHADS